MILYMDSMYWPMAYGDSMDWRMGALLVGILVG
jgi:hypothetical protein